MRLAIALTLLTMTATAHAEAPVSIVHAAHLFDGTKMRGETWVLVEHGRVARVSPSPIHDNGARAIELGSATLLPGLADVHAHLLLPDGKPKTEGRLVLLEESSAQKALRGLRAAQRLLDAGFTTLRDPGDLDVGTAHLAVRDAIDAGTFVGPHLYAAGRFITRTGGHMDDTWVAADQHIEPWARVADGVEAIVVAVREEVKLGADWIKVAVSGGGTMGAASDESSFTDEELRALVREAHRLHRKVAAHAHRHAAIAAAILAGVDSIEHGNDLTPDQMKEMARRGIYWVPTWYDGDSEPSRRDAWLEAWKKSESPAVERRMMAAARAAGVTIVFGTESGLYRHGEGARMLQLFVESGMPPAEALRTATTNAARLLGDADVGRIAVGSRADLIATDRNPLEDIRTLESVRFVMVSGTVVRAP